MPKPLLLEWQLLPDQIAVDCPPIETANLFCNVVRVCHHLKVRLDSLYVEPLRHAALARLGLASTAQSLEVLRQVPRVLKTLPPTQQLPVAAASYQDMRLFMPAYDNELLFKLATLLFERSVTLHRLRLEVEDAGSDGSPETTITGRVSAAALDLDQLQVAVFALCPLGSEVWFQAPLSRDPRGPRDRLVLMSLVH
jgi:hypothetical protein